MNTREENEQKIKEVCSKVAFFDGWDLDFDFVYDMYMDSIDVAEFQLKIEQEFGTHIPDDKWESITTPRKLLDYFDKIGQ